MQEFDFNHPESDYAMHKLLREGTAKTIVVGDESVLYIEINPSREYPPSALERIAEHVRTTFSAALPGTKIVVGYQGLDFHVISPKLAFEGKLKGTVK
jgi:hypothetical protein